MAGSDGQLSPGRRLAMALVAHDAKKSEMSDFAAAHQDALAGFELYATGTTGAQVIERCPGLSVTRLKSGPPGGDQQVGALIAEGRIDALLFFVDPLSRPPARRRRQGADPPRPRLRHPAGPQPRDRGAADRDAEPDLERDEFTFVRTRRE